LHLEKAHNMSTTKKKTIGTIGAGNIAQAFIKHVAKAGYQVTISNSRGPGSLSELAKTFGPGVKAGTVAEASESDIVFIGTPWELVPNAVKGVGNWGGRIVIDATNAIKFPEFKPVDLGPKTSSEVVAESVPGAHVVKAFNTLAAPTVTKSPVEAGGNRVIFFSGDDAGAKETMKELLTELGFAGIDLGSLATGGRLQQFGGVLATHNLIRLPSLER
jgi:predicted dinucleotide-binding enzyme